VCQNDRGLRLFFFMEPDRSGEVEVREDIAAYDDEPLIQESAGIADTSGSSKICLSSQILHGDSKPSPVVEVARNDVWLIVESRDHVGDSMLFQELDDMLHHRLVQHGNHRLWDVAGERPEAGTEATRHDHGFHQNVVLEW